MSKSVLIIDTPTNCFECPCFMDIGWRCQCRLDIDEDVHDGRPDWCPLVKDSTVEAIPSLSCFKTAELLEELVNRQEQLTPKWEKIDDEYNGVRD